MVTSKFSLGPEDKEKFALSSDLSRSSNGVECLGTKSSNKSNSSMEVSSEKDSDDENDDHLYKDNTSAGQGSEENYTTIEDETFSSTNSPFRKIRTTRIPSFVMKRV